MSFDVGRVLTIVRSNWGSVSPPRTPHRQEAEKAPVHCAGAWSLAVGRAERAADNSAGRVAARAVRTPLDVQRIAEAIRCAGQLGVG